MADKSLEEITNISAVKEKIASVSRELLTLKVTIPLGDPKLKEVHTNSYVWLPILDDANFDLENYELIIKEIINISHSTRTVKYIRDRWYVEGVNISNEAGGKFQIELTLNPLASSNQEYKDDYISFTKAWKEATSSSTSSSSSSSTTASTSGNSTLKGGQGTTIDNLVKNICGSEKDELKKCKLIHEWLKSNVKYSYYECTKYNTPEKCYNNRSHLNCADTARLTCSMMLSAGLNAYVVHRTTNGGHFWTIIEIGGKKYASDQTGSGSSFNTVWTRSSGRISVSNGGSYTRKNGSSPDC